MKKDIIDVILTILVILALSVIVFMLFLKILGKSPSIVELLAAIVIGLVLNTIRTEYSRGKFEGQFLEFQKNIKDSFVKIRENIEELKNIKKQK